jgi:hypothetical protein
MRTIRTKVYKFTELSEEAKQKAISHFQTINVDFNWWSSTYEDAENIGLKITSFDLDRNRHAKGEFLLAANEVAQNIFSNHGHECETYTTAEKFMQEWQPIFNNYMNEEHEMYESGEAEEQLQEIENDFLDSLLDDYSIMLQNECEYLQEDEAIIEAIEANEYEFTTEGNIL